MFINKYKPKTPVLIQNSKDSHLFNIFEGSGLEEVLDINSSVLASIIWLNPFDDPVIKIPPKISFKKVKEERFPSANRKPKKADITTRLDSLSFKRAIKPLNFKENDNLETVSKYYIFSEITTIYYL